MHYYFVALFLVVTLMPGAAFADGRELYDTLCATCHGADGRGDGPGVPQELIRPRPFSVAAFKFDTDADWQRGTRVDIANVIRDGTKAYGGSPLMPPWSNLSDADINSLVDVVLSFSGTE